MNIVEAKCPNCGAGLKVDTDVEATICEYCGKPFITEKAIKISGDYVKGNKVVHNVKQDNEWSFKTNETTSEYKTLSITMICMVVMLAIIFGFLAFAGAF